LLSTPWSKFNAHGWSKFNAQRQRKYFITSTDGKFGGIYIWRDEASAQSWFTPAWRDRVQKEYGQPASLEWFDTPILLPGQDAGSNWVKGFNPS